MPSMQTTGRRYGKDEVKCSDQRRHRQREGRGREGERCTHRHTGTHTDTQAHRHTHRHTHTQTHTECAYLCSTLSNPPIALNVFLRIANVPGSAGEGYGWLLPAPPPPVRPSHLNCRSHPNPPIISGEGRNASVFGSMASMIGAIASAWLSARCSSSGGNHPWPTSMWLARNTNPCGEVGGGGKQG